MIELGALKSKQTWSICLFYLVNFFFLFFDVSHNFQYTPSVRGPVDIFPHRLIFSNLQKKQEMFSNTRKHSTFSRRWSVPDLCLALSTTLRSVLKTVTLKEMFLKSFRIIHIYIAGVAKKTIDWNAKNIVEGR